MVHPWAKYDENPPRGSWDFVLTRFSYGRTDGRTDGRTTRKHNASGALRGGGIKMNISGTQFMYQLSPWMIAYLLFKDIVDTISQILIAYRAKQLRFFKVETLLKALFNNVFTLKIWAAWPYMLSVSLVRCKNEPWKNCTSFKSIIKCFKRVKIDKWPDSPY